jgi:hypothetical protein
MRVRGTPDAATSVANAQVLLARVVDQNARPPLRGRALAGLYPKNCHQSATKMPTAQSNPTSTAIVPKT